MNVEIIKNDKGYAIGWTMQGENKEEIAKLTTIRDLQFIGFDDTAIKYNGRKGGNDAEGNPGVLSCIQRRFSSDKK
jgi:hypothetical protein